MNKQSAPGFTLLELMIVIVLVAILSSVALANYGEHVRRSERVAARAVLLEAANWMERRFSMQHSYLGKDGQIPVLPAGLNQSPKNGAAKYEISLVSGQTQATAYALMAAPLRADKCGVLTLDHTGARGLLDNTAELEECWGR
ncbi:Type IV pilus biogenesis protein PilE [Collimonas arenae]|uniref:Type IV pilus biogenesis protein PilE n=1 Tax=Collimonas arenae TaxID=279058 RepID=A0A0A1FKA9_9BURK|nr:type IV pilin protein [Collimonas arenae]AIY44165.1 Type IV pilus biogenesis protein PilE [Collimonas arenae]